VAKSCTADRAAASAEFASAARASLSQAASTARANSISITSMANTSSTVALPRRPRRLREPSIFAP
jgi:hypothetical protein